MTETSLKNIKQKEGAENAEGVLRKLLPSGREIKI
jgi:hypothetical protein